MAPSGTSHITFVYISTRRIIQNITVISLLLPYFCNSVFDRIENRTSKIVRFRQSGINDAAWIRLEPRASTQFSWVNPYGQKSIDTEVHSDTQVSLCELNMENSGECKKCGEGAGVLFHFVEMGNIKVARFVDDESRSDGLGRSLAAFENWKIANMPNTEKENSSPLELIVELGVVGVSLVDHRPKELCYLYLERVFISYSTGYDSGTTSRLEFYPMNECIEFCLLWEN